MKKDNEEWSVENGGLVEKITVMKAELEKIRASAVTAVAKAKQRHSDTDNTNKSTTDTNPTNGKPGNPSDEVTPEKR